MKEPDWASAETLLFEKTTEAISAFSIQHPDETCSFLAFGVDYYHGDVAICFDTVDNSYRRARKHAWRVAQEQALFVGDRCGWETARDWITRNSNRISAHSPSSGYFKYDRFSLVHLSDWEPYFDSAELPDHPDPEGHVIVLFCKSIMRIVESGILGKLNQASPFRLGFEFHDSDLGLVVMRMLNWPGHAGADP